MSYHQDLKYREKLRFARKAMRERRGFINSPETREKMRVAKLGNTYRLGKKFSHSKETKEKISYSLIGEKNPNWKGGKQNLGKMIRCLAKYKAWRIGVFSRDNWTCQECQTRGVKIHPHHIIAMSILIRKNNVKSIEGATNCAELWNKENGITLCAECHKMTDTFNKRLDLVC